jgi:hypothetical protein
VKNSLILVIALFINCSIVNGQDTINLLSGKQIIVGGLTFDDPLLNFSGIYNKKGELKTKGGNIDYYRVFSVIDATKQETVLYRRDTLLGQDRSELEARYFTYGGQHAYKHVKPRWQFGAAAGTAFALSLFDTYNTTPVTLQNGTTIPRGFFKSEPSVLQVLIPFVSTAAFGFTRVKLRASQVRDRALLNDENFLMGFKRVARQKIVFAALKGALLGTAVGLTSYYVFKP